MAEIDEVHAAMNTIQECLARIEKEGRPLDPEQSATIHAAFDAIDERLQQELRRRGLRLPDFSGDGGKGDRPA
ncbi:hypothetical protein JMUB6875_51750 [Nocardia sp. JMUB6875]|uniref:hypothetical protein n=1 Tax=Nocardia sp. JMUB6875 TaxID=3158170 RepID=UPI0032E57D72